MEISGHIDIVHFYTDEKILSKTPPVEIFVCSSGKFAFFNLTTISRLQLVTTSFSNLVNMKEFR